MIAAMLVVLPFFGLAYLAWTVYQTYRLTPEQGWFSAFRGSLILLSSKILTFGGLLATMLVQVPGMDQMIIQVLPVSAVPLGMIIVGGLFWWLRLRAAPPLPSEPTPPKE